MAQANEISEQQTLNSGDSGTEKLNLDSHSLSTDPLLAATSLDDSGQGKRPRDARLLHIILASLGVQAYQERVPLQLMDFAYRYTSSILQDALHLTSETYGTTVSTSKNNPASDLGSVTLQSLRLAVASRQHYQFQPNLSKEHFQEIASDRNRMALPIVSKNNGIRLPPERYCLTGVGYNLRDEWDDEFYSGYTAAVKVTTSLNAAQRANGNLPDESLMQGVEMSERKEDDDEMVEA